jgi:hypothetical protein
MENMSLINPSALSLFIPGNIAKLSNNFKDVYSMGPNNGFNSTKKLF